MDAYAEYEACNAEMADIAEINWLAIRMTMEQENFLFQKLF